MLRFRSLVDDGQVVAKRLAELSGFVGYPLQVAMNGVVYTSPARMGFFRAIEPSACWGWWWLLERLPDIAELMDLLR